jgi:hypothetical protein
VLLGECWPPLIASIRENLVVSDPDIALLRFAKDPQEALHELQEGLQEKRVGPGPRG